MPSVLWRALASPKTSSILSILLAVVVLITLFFSPQRPGPSADAGELARWTSDAQTRFGTWYDTLLALGVFDVGSSVGLRLLLGLGALSLSVSLADRVTRVAGAWRRPDVRRPESFFQAASSSGEWRVSEERAVLVESLAQQLVWPGRLLCRRLRVRPRREEVAQVSYLYQDWLVWRQMLSLLMHLGLLLILAGVVLDAQLGWRQEGVMLRPGQAAPLAEMPGFSLRLEGVEGSGAVGEAVSQVVLDDSGGTPAAGRVALGQPYTAHGVTVYQRDVGPVLRVSAWGDDSAAPGDDGMAAPIFLKDVSVDMEPADEVCLVFTESRVEQYVLMPYIQKVVRLVLYRQGERWDVRRDELQVEVYAGNQDAPEGKGRVVGDGQIKLGGIVYQFAWGQYAVLDVVRSSYQWMVRIGMGLALLGLAATLLVPSARLWIRVAEEQEGCVIELAGEMPGGPGALDAWLAGWRRRLGGGDADG